MALLCYASSDVKETPTVPDRVSRPWIMGERNLVAFAVIRTSGGR